MWFSWYNIATKENEIHGAIMLNITEFNNYTISTVLASDTKKYRRKITMLVKPVSSAIVYCVHCNDELICLSVGLQEAIDAYNNA